MSYYSVYKGHTCGIFTSWNECQKNTSGFSGAIFKKFTNKEDAEYFLKFGKEFTPKKKIVIKAKNISKKEAKIFPKITVYTDGACSNNGAPNAKAGIGIYFDIDDKRNVSRKIDGRQTNNVAELTAILEVSKILSSEIESGIKVDICTDSEYSIKCCTSYGQKQELINWSKEIPNKELVKEIYNTYKNYSNVTLRHVKAHTGGTDIDSIGNANADRLANEAIGLTECPYTTSNKNIYLNIPFEHKDKVKALGGRWCPEKKQWYISNPQIDEDTYLFTDKEVKRIVKFFSRFIS